MLRILDVMIEALSIAAPMIEAIERRDPDLARQMRRSGPSVANNIAEGSGYTGRLRQLRYRNALGSAREFRASMQCAIAMRYVTPNEALFAKLLHVINVLVRVTC